VQMNNDLKETIFCFDSSALITLHNYYWIDILDDILEELETLFSNGRIVSHILVFNELTTKAKKPDDLSRWISNKHQYFKKMTGVQAQYVASIIKEFPRLIDPNAEKDQADPWLIAQILEDRSQPQLGFFRSNREFIVVSQEGERSPHKIPAVCKRYDIQHLNLKEFFKFNGWTLRLKKE